MDYDTFRELWHEALARAGLVIFPLRPTETIDVQRMTRVYRVYLPVDDADQPRPFYVTVELSWCWDALKSARMATTEEDLLMELLGEDAYDHETERPWMRIDFGLHATLPATTPLPMPDNDRWRRWIKRVLQAMASRPPPDLREGGGEEEELLYWLGTPGAGLECSSDGQLALAGVDLSGWWGIELPRQWDNPERVWDERGPERQLEGFCEWVRETLKIWAASLKHLVA